jgi:chromosome segregation ATPase
MKNEYEMYDKIVELTDKLQKSEDRVSSLELACTSLKNEVEHAKVLINELHKQRAEMGQQIVTLKNENRALKDEKEHLDDVRAERFGK